MPNEPPPAFDIVDYRPEYASWFERLTREWVEKYFRVEQADREIFENPERAILEPGGEIYFARLGGSIVGTCALKRLDPDTFELVKMGVTPAAQGHGIGERLCRHAIERARRLGARRVVLETNSRLHAANRVYTKLGFVRESAPPASDYERADVAMHLDLLGGAS